MVAILQKVKFLLRPNYGTSDAREKPGYKEGFPFNNNNLLKKKNYKVMKMQSTGLFIQMGAKQLENLTTVVNETLAFGSNPPKSKIFTAAELWNIQRQGKSRIQRRMFV